MLEFIELENQRQQIQAKFDALKSQKERNILGQFATPIALANSIFEQVQTILPKNTSIRFLDPAIGTGSFYSALNNIFDSSKIETAVGYEIDKHYAAPTRKLWFQTPLEYRFADFTKATPPSEEKYKYNLIVCNPPYVRHHHINANKKQLKQAAFNAAEMNLSGLAGLYCYFLALSHCWMQSNCIAAWLLPSEFMDVNYGQAVKNYLLNKVTLLQIHRFDPIDVQFDDALVSSVVVWFKNRKPNVNHEVKFSFGSKIDKPIHIKSVKSTVLASEKKWTRFPLYNERIKLEVLKLSYFFTVKRGIATGDNSFFIISIDELKKRDLPITEFRPILPSPRYLSETEIKADVEGCPIIDNQLFVLDSKLSIEEIQKLYPALYDYLQEGIQRGVVERYICKKRKIWYAQEKRITSSFYCTYIGRSNRKEKKPFRFILNFSKAIVTNSYLILYPKNHLAKKIEERPELLKQIKESLDRISTRNMLEEGRVYGGGMHKLEPKELSNVLAKELAWLIDSSTTR